MGRKNRRLQSEPEKLPAPTPAVIVRRPAPRPRTTSASDFCSFANCSHVAAIFLWPGQVCEKHADAIWERVEMRDAHKRHEDIPGMESRDYVRDDARKIRAAERRKPTSQGQIYFVRMDGLIKVGWTSKLAERVRAYGPKPYCW